MKKITLCLFVMMAMLISKKSVAQTEVSTFTGAEATLDHYKAVYYLDDADPNKIQHTLANMNNVLEDARLKGKIEMELVVFGDGVAAFQKTSTYEDQLSKLVKKGVIMAMCNNTMRSRHIEKDTLFPFIGYVPSGNGEIVIRAAQGWVSVHP